MARSANQTNDYEYTVEAVKLLTPEGNESGWFGNRRTDTQEILGICTEQYNIIQNADLFDKADEAIAARGLVPTERKIVVSDNGAKVRGIYDFSNQTRKVKNVGDEMGFRLIVNNSFDRSLRISFQLGLLRLVCTNGMTTLEKEFDLTKKHSQQCKIEDLLTADKLDTAFARFDDSLNVYSRLAAVDIEQEQGLNVLQRLTKNNTISEKLREGIANIWNNPTHDEDKERNLYNLNNAVTQYLSENVSGERFEYANRITNQVLRSFNRAANSKPTLKKLTSALPAEMVVNN
jgi:hypothetical protein